MYHAMGHDSGRVRAHTRGGGACAGGWPVSEDEAFSFFAALAAVCIGFALWRWRPTRVLIVVVVMAIWGSVVILAPICFAVQRIAEGRYAVAGLTLVAPIPMAAPYLVFAWPAFIKFWRREVLGEITW